MAPRGSETADRMAQYKKDASNVRAKGRGVPSRQRSSPRSKNPKRAGSNSTRKRDVPADTDGTVGRMNESPRASPRNQKRVLKPGKDGSLEYLMEIPETPVRECGASGSKRVHAPGSHNSEDGEDTGDANSLNNESQIPSKKRKTFHTPRREGSFTKRRTFIRSSSPVLGEHDIECDFDDIEPPVPTHMGTFVPASNNIGGGRDSTLGLRLMQERNNTGDVATPSATPSHGVRNIATSTATLKRLFEMLEGKLFTEIDRVRHDCLTEVRDVSSALSKTFSSKLRNVSGMIEMMSKSGLKGKQVRKGSKKTTLAEWEKKLDDLIPNATIIFSTEVLAKVISYNEPLKAVHVYTSGILTEVENASEAVEALLISLRPGGKRNEYGDGIGKLHSESNFVVVQNAFYNVCKNPFRQFWPSPSSLPGEGTLISSGASDELMAGNGGCSSSEGDGRISCPALLRPGFVSIDHIRWAGNFKEKTNQLRKDNVRSTPTPNDVACHGALSVIQNWGVSFTTRGTTYGRHFSSVSAIF